MTSYSLDFGLQIQLGKKFCDSELKERCASFPSPLPLHFLSNEALISRLFAGEMVRQARVLAQATSDLVNAMRSDAEIEVDVDNSKKLLAAAKLLADATARMVEAAKVSSI